MSTASEAYARLLARGCLCGTARAVECKLHGPNDNRGIAAFFKAGMPDGFPMVANCSLCRAESLMYPSVPLDRGEVPAGAAPAPTLVCPRCSRAASERALRAEASAAGYQLNTHRVFSDATSEAA